MICGIGLPGEGADQNHIMVLVGLDPKYLENIRTHGPDSPTCLPLPNGMHIKLVLFWGATDADLVREAEMLAEIVDDTVIVDTTGKGLGNT